MIEKKFRHSPTKKQYLAIQALYDATTEYIAFGGGAGGGKTFLGCEWLIAMCLNFSGTRYFIGRKTLKDIKVSTLLTFYKVARHHGIRNGIDYRYNDNQSQIIFNNGSSIFLLDLAYNPSDPLYEGLGSIEFTSGMIEEGGEIHFNAFDTLKSRVGRCGNDLYGILGKILITCNPKKNWLYQTFYKPYREGKLPYNYCFIQSLVGDNEHIDSGYIDKLQSLKDKAKKERLLYGNWEYDTDNDALMEYDSITDIFTNTFVKAGDKYITSDIARFGEDLVTIGVWSGMRCEKPLTYAKIALNDTADKIRRIATSKGIPMSNVIVDEDGVGGGVKDLLRCKGFINNSSPLKISNQSVSFDNLKSQCYYKLADVVNASQLFVDCSDDPELQNTIIEEMEQVKSKDIDSDKKLGVVPKEKVKQLLGRSPNYSDMLMMRMYFVLAGPRMLTGSPTTSGR